MLYGFRLLICLILMFSVLTGCSLRKHDEKVPRVLYDFEDDSQLDSLSWKCGTIYERVQEHKASGAYSLMVEMYPGVEWPGFGMAVRDGWKGYSELSFHVFNPSSEPLIISYRIDDSRSNPPYADRANGRISIRPGSSTVTLDIAHMKTSGTERLLRLEKVCCFLMFLHRPDHKATIFLDDITLR